MFGVVRNELCKKGVTRTELFEDGLEHLGLLLDDLAKLLELWVVSEEVEVPKTLWRASCRCSLTSAARGRSTTALLSGSKIKEVHTAFVTATCLRGGSGFGRRGGSCRGRRSASFLCEAFGDTLYRNMIVSLRRGETRRDMGRTRLLRMLGRAGPSYVEEIFHGTVGVEIGCTHGNLNLRPLETHGF